MRRNNVHATTSTSQIAGAFDHWLHAQEESRADSRSQRGCSCAVGRSYCSLLRKKYREVLTERRALDCFTTASSHKQYITYSDDFQTQRSVGTSIAWRIKPNMEHIPFIPATEYLRRCMVMVIASLGCTALVPAKGPRTSGYRLTGRIVAGGK